jgi:dipeptidyl aminopeptidase/acylaminoacyl peptidase
MLLLLGVAACGAATEPVAAPPGSATVAPTAAPTVVPSAAPKAEAPAGHAPRAPIALDEYFKVQRVGAPSFSADEKLVVYPSDEGGRMDLWVQPIAGGKPTQITHVSGFIQSYAFSPKEDRLVYETDQGGNELPHLFMTNAKGESPKDLCADYPKTARTQFVEWASDGKTFLFLSSARDEKALDLVEYDVAKGKSTTLWQSTGDLSFALASRDHQLFIVQATLNDSNSNLYLVRRGKKGEPELLTKHEGDVQYAPAAFSRDDKTFYFTSDQDREYQSLYAMDLAKKKVEKSYAPKWDVDSAAFSSTFRYRYTVTNVDGTEELALTEAATGKAVKLPAPPVPGSFSPTSFSPGDRYLGARLTTDASPADAYVIDLKSGTATRLTNSLPESLRKAPMVAGQSVRIPSFDGKEVPAFLMKPLNAAPGAPAIIDVHGGPTAQSQRRFSHFRQYLLAKGYTLLVPNVRGSTGYGKTYTKLDNLDLGGGPLKDIVACKQWLVKNAGVGADKVVVLGGSYGGYMALAAATFTPDEFAASVDYFGVSDLKSLVESFPPYWASFSSYIFQKFGDPKNPAHAQYQHDRSPAYFLDRVSRPLLVVQGENDARVKKDQSDRVVEALKKRSVPVHYLVLPGEGHGFSRNENMAAAYGATDRFLDRYLWNDTSVVVLPGGG